jgi:hypothetical protein
MVFLSKMVPHIPPKGLQMVRYAGLYARCITRSALVSERRLAVIANAALEVIRAQIPLFDLDPLLRLIAPPKWRDRITRSAAGAGSGASFGYDPLSCPNCGCIMELAENWAPKRGFVWMKQWLETHRTLLCTTCGEKLLGTL